MLLEQLAYLAEIVGVFGVIASLIYVGMQLRQNAQQMQVSAAGMQTQWLTDTAFRVAHNAEFAELWSKGASEFDGLSELDKQRLILHESGAITLWSHFFNLQKADALWSTSWQRQLWGFRTMGARQSTRAAWRHQRDAYDPEFQELLDGYLNREDSAGEPNTAGP